MTFYRFLFGEGLWKNRTGVVPGGFINAKQTMTIVDPINVKRILKTGISSICFICLYGALSAQTAPPQLDTIAAYDSHLELRWNAPSGQFIRIFRAGEGQEWQFLERVPIQDSLYIDFVGHNNDTSYQYAITTLDQVGRESAPSDTLSGRAKPMDDEDFLDMVQAYTFRYFWDFAHPESGLTRERNTSDDVVTMGGSGFGCMAILVGIERGYITRSEGLQRLLTIVDFLESADRFYGVFPHWMNGTNGSTIPFSTFDDGGDIVETAFLLQGLLTVRTYFSGNSANEVVLRQKITNIWETVNWNWYRKQDESIIYWHWSPNHGFRINLPVRGFNESLIVYVLAASSPTHTVPARTYHEGWAGNNYENGRTYFGTQLPLGPGRGGPLFFTHYSFMGLDPRGLSDDYANYFTQGVAQTTINRDWCIVNPGNYEGYGENCWGLTASDDPIQGYLAHEPDQSRDNGTITPTAALSSMPYTPEASIAALKHMYRTYGEELWGPMGFYDAFNPSLGWTADSYLAIDQGPIIGMIENYRSGLLWDYFMQDEAVLSGLDQLGFLRDTTTVSVPFVPAKALHWRVWPNPVASAMTVDITLDQAQHVSLQLSDTRGRPVWAPRNRQNLPAGQSTRTFSVPDRLPAGMYFLTVRGSTFRSVLPVQITK